MVVVVSTTGDPRSRLVDEAVTFWNKTQAEIGSGLRLGSITHIVQLMPEEALQSLSQSVLGALGGAGISQSLRDPPGDITIYLSRSEFVSFTGRFDANMKAGDKDSRSTISTDEPAQRRAERDHARAWSCDRVRAKQRSLEVDVRPPGAV
jgi:hypothetical protein